MSETITKICNVCKKEMVYEYEDIDKVVYFKNKYYHHDCFMTYAEGRVAINNKHSPVWQEALNNLDELEIDTIRMLKTSLSRNLLNEHLLNYYNITEVPKKFWEVVSDIAAGKHNGKRCRPVSTIMIYRTWQWGQKKLNKINHDNKVKKSGPKDDGARLFYDLAIVLQKVPAYIEKQEKIKAEEIERLNAEKEKVKINYNLIPSSSSKAPEGLDDISSLLDDIF